MTVGVGGDERCWDAQVDDRLDVDFWFYKIGFGLESWGWCLCVG